MAFNEGDAKNECGDRSYFYRPGRIHFRALRPASGQSTMSGIMPPILGEVVLHGRFQAALFVLLDLVLNAPRSVSVAEMEARTTYPRKRLLGICKTLQEAEIVKPDPMVRDAWVLACVPGVVTLEDVFCCAIAQSATARAKKTVERQREMASFHSKVNLIVTQAVLSTNQIIRKNLRNFPLSVIARNPD